jgi:hypothetical protein
MGRKRRDTPMQRVNHFLTVEQVERIEAACERTGLDRSAIIRMALDTWLDKSEKARRKKP